jgi:hypothetical protein
MYTVYKITNNTNEKYYIGVHKTNDPNDSYMGSGVAIKAAIKKYGRENFTKEILYITENKEEAYSLERKITLDCNMNITYNMKIGGVGGWSKEASKRGGEMVSRKHQSAAGKKTKDMGVGIHALSSEEKKNAGRLGGIANKGKPKSEEQKAKIAASLKGKKYKPRNIVL